MRVRRAWENSRKEKEEDSMNTVKPGLLGGAFAIAVIATSPTASAQVGDTVIIGTGTQMFSGFVGAQWFDIADQLDELGDNVETELNLGLRYQYNFTPHFGLEGNFMYSPAQHEFLGPEGGGIGSADVDGFYYNANAVYNILPANNVIPYVTGGVGAVTLRVDDPVLEGQETKLAGNFGAGILFAMNEHFGLRFDVRDYIYRVDELDTQFRHAFNVPAGFEETVNDVTVTGGFSIIF
jgi:outer membrane beta-barrel protein